MRGSFRNGSPQQVSCYRQPLAFGSGPCQTTFVTGQPSLCRCARRKPCPAPLLCMACSVSWVLRGWGWHSEKPWLPPVCPLQVPEEEKQGQQTEVREPTPTPEDTSQDVTTVTLLLRAPPGGTPSSPASPDSSPTTASPEPLLEPAGAQCPASEAPVSSEPLPHPSEAPSPEPPMSPAPPSSQGRVISKVSWVRDGDARQVSSLVREPFPMWCFPWQPLLGSTEPSDTVDSTRGSSNTKRAGEDPCTGYYGLLLSPVPSQLSLSPSPFPAFRMGSDASLAFSGPGSP